MSYESSGAEAANSSRNELALMDSETRRPTALMWGSREMVETAERLRHQRAARDGGIVTGTVVQLSLVELSSKQDTDPLPPAA